MTKEEDNLTWLDDILDKLFNDEIITDEEVKQVLEYVAVPQVLADELGKQDLHYIELIDHYDLIHEFPNNPLDAGGKEHLTQSIEVANRLHARNQLSEEDMQHIVEDILTPLQFIFYGEEDQSIKSVLKMLENASNVNSDFFKGKDGKGERTEKFIKELTEGTYERIVYAGIQRVSTKTFVHEIDKRIEDVGSLKHVDDDSVEIREFLPELEQFRYGNTKVENELKNPKRSISDTLTSGGFIADITSRKDKLKGYNYEVPAHFSVSDGVSFPRGFSYTLSTALLVNAIGNAYDLAELETQSAGAKTIRADHLINIMNGDALTTDVRPEAVQNLIEEIEPLTTVRVEIDATEHQAYNDRSNKKVQLAQNKFTGYLLPIEVIERTEQSKSKQVYLRILTRPALYNYANQTGQIIKVKYHTLDLTKEYLEDGAEKPTIVKRMSQQTRSIRDFIINQIYGRGRNLKYTDVKYSTIYDFIEKDLGSKPRKQTLDNNIERVMLALEQKGAVKKYEVIPQGRKKLYKLRIYGGNE